MTLHGGHENFKHFPCDRADNSLPLQICNAISLKNNPFQTIDDKCSRIDQIPNSVKFSVLPAARMFTSRSLFT